MNKLIVLESAKDKLAVGINKLADAVKITMGAAGQTVIIEDRYGNPKITKDGVTVAEDATPLPDPIENMGALVLKQAASKTATEAGDGTTTSTVLAQALVNEANKIDSKKYLLSEVKKGMNMAVADVIAYISSLKVDVSDQILIDVATISTNNDEELGIVIANAFVKAGTNGVVTMEESASAKTYVEESEGMELERGWASRLFITDHKKESCVMENALVFVCDVKIQNIRQVEPLLTFAIQQDRALFIIADMEDDVLNTLTINKIKGNMAVNVIKPPMFGIKRKEMMSDIATITGALVVSDETGDNFETVDVSFFGGAKKVTSTKHKTTIVAHKVDDSTISDRVVQLKEQIDESESDVEIEWLKERIAKLVGGVSVIYVGASSEIELGEKKDRVDDAIQATRAAIQEGIVSGGGVALYDASYRIESNGNKNIKKGYILVLDAIRKPLEQILINAGVDHDSIITQIFLNNVEGYGYNVKNEQYGNMMEMGIIDPLKVVKSALTNAVSVASTIMNTGGTITNIKP